MLGNHFAPAAAELRDSVFFKVSWRRLSFTTSPHWSNWSRRGSWRGTPKPRRYTHNLSRCFYRVGVCCLTLLQHITSVSAVIFNETTKYSASCVHWLYEDRDTVRHRLLNILKLYCSHFVFIRDFTLLCFSKESSAVHQASLSLLFFSQDGCTHPYIIPLPSQTYTHFPCALLYFAGLAARVCLGFSVEQRYENSSAGLVARPWLHYLFLFDCCPPPPCHAAKVW